MSVALLTVELPLKRNYFEFFNTVFGLLDHTYTGCDVLIGEKVVTSVHLSHVLLELYSQLRDAATGAGHAAGFSINVLLYPAGKTLEYSAAFKVQKEPIVGVCGTPVTDVEIDVSDKSSQNTELKRKILASETSIEHLQSSAGAIGSSNVTPSPLQESSLTEGQVDCVAVGGTFDHLHDGHKILLLLTTFCAASKIIVGVTGDELLKGKKFRDYLEALPTRIASVCSFLQKIIHSNQRFVIYQINDICGPTGYIEAIDALVISQETTLGAAYINKIRSSKNYRQLKIVCAHVIGGDGTAENNWKGKLSSTDLRELEAKKRKTT